ncbi:N-formylglutamate amidohydrolase [Pararhodospirillum photometricum]|uniref:N-formylglutamate amidohydrolase n=1 Tax=Pararhodospirillum photometricum DSM 122 TaxID=1150469 RepID=H6SP62_PARPM|nr:N-formylglutamate amidohydrolase [Pararhodospirillum photometricum]CCG07134.1 N-formylglutamate amidohydrolase [Pararhodospirillum photometricum DSM 122]
MSLLTPEDPPPFTLLTPESPRPLLFVCDHAGQQVPRALDLGVGDEVLAQHVGWDIGAAAVTRFLADAFQASAVLAAYSRLVIDLNRAPGDPSAFPVEADGHLIPGNAALTESQQEARRDALFWPYHFAVAERLAHLWHGGKAPVLVCVHTFTPVFQGLTRPWHIGLLYNHDRRLTDAVGRPLQENNPDIIVGDNQPYSGKEVGYTATVHAEPAGLAHLGVEIRQDLVATPAGVATWGRLFADSLDIALQDESLFRQRLA